MFHCFDHEIVLEGMKEEISQQRCTIGAHWYTNNLPENRASKTNVDVVDKKVNSETKLSTREVCVPHGHPIIRPEGAKRIGSNEAFPFRVKNSFQKIMKLVFKSGVWKASIKSRKVPSTLNELVSESCFSSSVRITSNELLMIHMLLTPVRSRIVLQ